jgi:hypothetical protein
LLQVNQLLAHRRGHVTRGDTEESIGAIATREIPMKKSTTLLLAAGLTSAVLGAGIATSARAETAWQAHHPRRTEVNHRLNNQDRRINHEYREGEISGRQAARLHREDRQIRHEERAMASQNGSHITRSEQRTLNQQENAVSHRIGQ